MKAGNKEQNRVSELEQDWDSLAAGSAEDG